MINEKYNKSYIQGYKVEKYFEEICIKNNIKILPTTEHENINDHIDFIIYINDKKYTVDVKDEKKKNRYDADTEEKVVWIELKNVNGNEGWIYGKANFIAFKHINSFIVVKRTDLILMVDNKRLKWDDGRVKKGKNFYETYSRDGRKDEIIMFPITDILKLKHKILK